MVEKFIKERGNEMIIIKTVKKCIVTSIYMVSFMIIVAPVTTHAGVIADGITASTHKVCSSTKGYYAYGSVTSKKSHTTTAYLKYNGKVVKQKTSAQDTGKVDVKTGTSSTHTSGYKSSVSYHLYE